MQSQLYQIKMKLKYPEKILPLRSRGLRVSWLSYEQDTQNFFKQCKGSISTNTAGQGTVQHTFKASFRSARSPLQTKEKSHVRSQTTIDILVSFSFHIRIRAKQKLAGTALYRREEVRARWTKSSCRRRRTLKDTSASSQQI